MGTLWIPGAERLSCSKPGGTITSTAPPRAVWHAVEGTSGSASAWTSSIRVLNEKSAEPQVLWDPITDRLGQFMPLNLSGRALKNDGASQTNRVGRVCIQIEVIAFSAKPFTAYWKPGKNFKALVAALRSWGITVDVWPAGPPPKFIASPPHNVPENDRDRKTWLTKGGYFSHSQIPANDHGDPGGIDTAALATAGKPTAKPPVIPPPVTPPKDVIDMATPVEVATAVEAGIRTYLHDFYDPKGTGGVYHQQEVDHRVAVLAAMKDQTDAIKALAAAIAAKV